MSQDRRDEVAEACKDLRVFVGFQYAADLLESQAAEMARLREALIEIGATCPGRAAGMVRAAIGDPVTAE